MRNFNLEHEGVQVHVLSMLALFSANLLIERVRQLLMTGRHCEVLRSSSAHVSCVRKRLCAQISMIDEVGLS